MFKSNESQSVDQEKNQRQNGSRDFLEIETPPFISGNTLEHKIARFRKLKMDYNKLTVAKLKDELKKRGLETDVREAKISA